MHKLKNITGIIDIRFDGFKSDNGRNGNTRETFL